MALHDYTTHSHPSGFTGYRVTRCIAGKRYQFYFPSDQKSAAIKCENDLDKRSIAHKQALQLAKPGARKPVYTSERYKAPRRTSIPGITCVLKHPGAGAGVTSRWLPALRIASTNTLGETLSTTRNINAQRNLSKTWRLACKLLAEHHHLKRVPAQWYKAEPPAAQFKALVKYYRQQGKSIPGNSLDGI